MALKEYGVLKGRAISRHLGSGVSPHYQIHIIDEAGTNYRIAINVKSQLVPLELCITSNNSLCNKQSHDKTTRY